MASLKEFVRPRVAKAGMESRAHYTAAVARAPRRLRYSSL